ncbi:hypothetical protein AGMMS50262_22790 [Bacteroidia bacterium]|nr:hypothetical protein AGMMS50262_22790 [Bacteroidia bacterium]
MYKPFKTLLLKELRQNLYSLSGIVFMLLFLLLSGLLLWFFPGNYNLIENGYASLSAFFSLAPILLLFLIPALSMRSLAEEKRTHTLTLLLSRPVSVRAILYSKITALFLTVGVTLLPTIIYVITLYHYGNPIGNVDLGAVGASYIGLLCLSLAFIQLSVFASSLTSNQVISLIISMLLCAFFYYGWDLLSLEKMSFLYHYRSVQQGLIESRDLCYFLAISVVFFFLTWLIISYRKRNFRTEFRTLYKDTWIIFILLGLIFNARLDWTKDQRYTLHPVSKNLLKTLENPLNVEIYLTGNLNPGFARLQEATVNILNNLNDPASQKIDYQLIDPYKQGKDFVENLNKEGIYGISVNEKLPNGRLTQNIIFPYALLKQGENQTVVPLLVNQPGRSGEENLNLSVEMLEYRFVHAIQQITQQTAKRIVFLEGHDELPETAVSELTDELSYEYTIDRGTLSGRTGELDGYDLVIIAGAQLSFSEQDKFVLDQYLMNGGNLLWLINGVQIHSLNELAQTGETMSRPNSLNLDDLFFRYGFRINPVILQDLQSLNIPIPQKNEAGQTEYVAKPWYYSALLTPNNRSEITKGLSFVKTGFCSTISLVGEAGYSKKEILLSSSPYAHLVSAPALVSLEETGRQPDKNYFNEANLPAAVLIQSPFTSAFRNRMFDFFPAGYTVLSESVRPAKLIAVASETIATNPLGYDAYSQTTFANKEFLLNAVRFLTDTTGIFALKDKSLQMQLLNKLQMQQNQQVIIFINVILPPIVLLIAFVVWGIMRKRKYH